MQHAGKSRKGRNDPSVMRDNALICPGKWDGKVPLKAGTDCIDEQQQQQQQQRQEL